MNAAISICLGMFICESAIVDILENLISEKRRSNCTYMLKYNDAYIRECHLIV